MIFVERWQIAFLSFARFEQLTVVSVLRNGSDGFVVTHTCFHVRHNLAQRLERKGAEFVEPDFAQRVDHGLATRQIELAEFAFDFGIVLANRQHPGDAVEQIRIAFERRACHALPFGFQSLVFQ